MSLHQKYYRSTIPCHNINHISNDGLTLRHYKTGFCAECEIENKRKISFLKTTGACINCPLINNCKTKPKRAGVMIITCPVKKEFENKQEKNNNKVELKHIHARRIKKRGKDVIKID